MLTKWRLFGMDLVDGQYGIGTIELHEVFADIDLFRAINLQVKVHSITGSTILTPSNARLIRRNVDFLEVQSSDGIEIFYRAYTP